MTLASGTRIGAYEIVALLGAGGMGEVYRAKDGRLNRDVALKIVPDAFAADPDRLARFTREAQTLAALNHPNIAHVHGLEESHDVRALVMELVEGQDLSDIIARGRLPIAEALAIARQIADALEAAHEQGIVHRDLKPANVKVRPDGTVKVLDFGLAKAMGAPGSDDRVGQNAIHSPTMTARATQMGTIIGTAAYMSPEQARGKPADRRADIWAFGVVLYEMLTGRRAFVGDDISDVLAAVLKTDPELGALPGDTPPAVRRLLRRCLEKDPRRRLSAIGDARLEFDEPAEPPTSTASTHRSIASSVWPAAIGATLVALVALVVAAAWPFMRPATPASISRLSILPPPGTSLYPDSVEVVISPDGKWVAYIVGDATTDGQLWVRSLDSLTATKLADKGNMPFWSPDSRRIAFFSERKLKTIPVGGGRAEVLSDAPFARGGSWSASNVIVFAPDSFSPLYRVSANGGERTPVTSLDASRPESGHRFPTFLPDGDHFLYAALPGRAGRFDIFAGSLADGSRALVGSMESAPVFAEPGWLLYARRGVLVAQPFDAKTLTLTGEALPLDDEPSSIVDPALSWTAGHSTSVSRTGALAYYSAASTNTIAQWLDAAGTITGALSLPPGYYSGVKISPDGSRAAVVRSASPSESTIWIVDLVRGGAVQVTSGPGRDDAPVWSPDGTRIVFANDRDGPQNLYVKVVGDAAPSQLLYRSNTAFKNPDSWSADGRFILFRQTDPDTRQNIWLLPAAGTEPATPYVQGRDRDNSAVSSPDGQWLAYVSEETGRFELFVQSFPVPGRKTQISTNGAIAPLWTRDSRQLLYVGLDLQSFWRVDLEPGPVLKPGIPRRLATLPANLTGMDGTPDRQRFLVLVPEHPGVGSVTVVQNWRAALGDRR